MANNRNYAIAKRGTGLSDLSAVTDKSGAIDVFGDAFMRSMVSNNVYQIGIGTETEIGLEINRYPIRVVIVGGTDATVVPTVCAKYWSVVNSAGAPIAFTRSPALLSQCILSLYSHEQEFDVNMTRAEAASLTEPFVIKPEWEANVNSLYNLTQLASPTPTQDALISQTISGVIQTALTAKAVPYFKVGENAYLIAKKHGTNGGGNYAEGTANRPTVANYVGLEFILTMVANYNRLHAAYPTCSTGLKTLCAMSIGWMFGKGVFECSESREFVTIVCGPMEANADANVKRFPIVSLDAPDGYVWPADLAVGQFINCSGVKADRTFMTVAPALVYLAGVNHYSFNHTTNGMRVGGPMLSLLLMYHLYNAGAAENNEEEQTRLIYETLHPVNKRAIANIFFQGSLVSTWGKSQSNAPMQLISLDTFLAIRSKPVPAGAHKAYLAGSVLEKVLSQQFAAFLPWVGEIANVVAIIRTVVNQGARSHIGSSYYTGEPGVTQSSALDPYMPDLAQFVQVMMPRDTLAMSPHLSAEVAARSDQRWSNLLKTVRSKEVTNVTAERVGEFLRSTGTFSLSFNPDDPATWATVAENSIQQAKVLGEVLRSGN